MNSKILISCLILFSISFSIFAQKDLFEDTTALKLSILTDIEAILADRGDSVNLHKARFNFEENGKQISMRAKIRARGNFRKNPAVCTFPPLKVYIEKENRIGNMFAKHKALKLVCHCREESAILQEYLIYKVYQMLTPYSFSVRLAEITYFDLNGQKHPEKHYGFFIEDDKRVAKRNGGKRFKEAVSRIDSIQQNQLQLVHAFMYMIGNMDWHILMQKNIKLVIPQKDALLLPVPYDFDWSGLVNASYTGLTEEFNRRSLNGMCINMEEWQNLAKKFLAVEDQIYQLYKDFGRLNSEERARAIQYYKHFFRIISKEKRIQHNFIEPCSKKDASAGKIAPK